MARSGILNGNIEIYRKTVIKNDFGEYSESWNLLKSVRAYTHYNSGAQILNNDEVFDIIKLKITIRNQTDITEQDRLKINGNMYLIEFLQPDYSKRWLEIRCTRINE